MALTWKDYCGLRGINESKYFKDNNILTYGDIVDNLKMHGDVQPPSKKEFEIIVLETKKVYGEKPKPSPKPSSKSKLPTPKSTTKTSVQKVDISKRSTSPKRSTKKRSTKRKVTPQE